MNLIGDLHDLMMDQEFRDAAERKDTAACIHCLQRLEADSDEPAMAAGRIGKGYLMRLLIKALSDPEKLIALIESLMELFSKDDDPPPLRTAA